jgi:hypothetical protein
MLILVIMEVEKVLRWGGLYWHSVHNKFIENLLVESKVAKDV